MKCPYCAGSGEIQATHPGPYIRAERDRQGLTQAELAERVGLSRTQVTNIEAGRGDTTIQTLMRFAHALGVRAGDLLP